MLSFDNPHQCQFFICFLLFLFFIFCCLMYICYYICFHSYAHSLLSFLSAALFSAASVFPFSLVLANINIYAHKTQAYMHIYMYI